MTEVFIRDATEILDDRNIQLKVGNYEFDKGPDFKALEVCYHHECKREYLNASRNHRKGNWKRNYSSMENKATNKIVGYPNTSIISRNKAEFLSTISERYKQSIYLGQEGTSKNVEFYFAQSFTKKLRTFCNEQQLNIQAMQQKRLWFGKLDQCLLRMQQSSPSLVRSQIFYQYGNVQKIKGRYFAFWAKATGRNIGCRKQTGRQSWDTQV